MSDDRAKRFAALYEDSYGAIHAYASRRVGQVAADEIAAETFLVAWRKFDTLPADPLPWLYGVARNMVARDHAASGRQRETRMALERERRCLDEDADDPQLWDAWEQLNAADREVLALVAWEELSVADAARALGCSAPVFSVRLHRARGRLRRLLANESWALRSNPWRPDVHPGHSSTSWLDCELPIRRALSPPLAAVSWLRRRCNGSLRITPRPPTPGRVRAARGAIVGARGGGS